MSPKISVALIFLISFTLCQIVNGRRTPILRPNCGPMRGLLLHTVWNSIPYSSFKGIPYAKPPVGDLRFKPPLPIKPWRRVLNASEEGSVCVQFDTHSKTLIGNEDCLYLNVFTPQIQFRRPDTLKPVMVWIYGGAFLTGYSNTSLYGPDFFIEENVVFVSFNYRLGALGFLALNHQDATGNAGLKDQNLVLQWVQRNIAVFGGDPDQVTIFGQSAGGVSVGFHILSEKSKGLFLRSISMSGVPVCPWAYNTREQSIANAYELALIMGFVPKNENDLLNFLLRAPAGDIVKATQKVALGFLPFRPTSENILIAPADSTFFTECPIKKYDSGNFYQHSMMLGYTHDEVILFLGLTDIVNMTTNVATFLKNLSALEEPVFGKPGQLVPQLLDKIKRGYEEIIQLGTDIFFSGPIDLTQRMLVRQNANHPIYYYRLSYVSKYAYHNKVDHIPLNGTSHSDDVSYTFNLQALHAPRDPRNSFNQFRKRMVALWANFAKYGNPTPDNTNDPLFNVTWADSGISGKQLDINVALTMNDRLIDELTRDFEKLYYTALPLLTSCTAGKRINIF